MKTVYTFKVPVSYCGKRARLGDAMSCRPSEHKAVVKSDLGITVEDLPKSDLIKTTLLCALERELKVMSFPSPGALGYSWISLHRHTVLSQNSFLLGC